MPTTKTRRTRKNQQEREAEIAQLKTTLDDAVERLANDPKHWVEFLDGVANFVAHYSLNNQLLILAQAAQRGFTPTMVRLYGRRDPATGAPRAGWAGGWLALGRHPRKGETALKIRRPIRKRATEAEAAAHLAATGRPLRRDAAGRLPERIVSYGLVSVFDIAQTEGEPVEVPTRPALRRVLAPGAAGPELLAGDDTTASLAEVIALIAEQGYAFEQVDPATLRGANGTTDSTTGRVQVRNDVDPAHTVKTAVHELAHILCGHLDPSYGYQARRGQAETEAESVAYIVCGALGLDTGAFSAPYVAGWSDGDLSKVAVAARQVIAVSRRILAALDPTALDPTALDPAEDNHGAGDTTKPAAQLTTDAA